jgi:enterochelin esterase-like enzyme
MRIGPFIRIDGPPAGGKPAGAGAVAGPGHVLSITHHSDVLRDNPLDDPFVRELIVLLPPGYSTDRRYPVVYWLAGFGSRGRSLLGAGPLTEAWTSRLGAEMASAQGAADALVVLPDCSTRYGGSQYLDSPRCGRYLSYLTDEIVPYVDANFPTLGQGRRAVGGKSSGGFGAIRAAMAHPDVFTAVCAHSPDAGFEHSYLSLLPRVLDTLRARGGIDRFVDEPTAVVPHDAAFMVAMSLVATAACYAPATGEPLSEAFPCDPRSGVFRDRVWRNWLEHDPVRLVRPHAAALRSLDFLFLDVGQRDDYAMHWGARALHAALDRAQVPHTYEEHDGGHHGIEHRFLRSTRQLMRRWTQ